MQNNARTNRKITNASLSLHDYGHDLINFNEAMPRMRNSAAIIHGIKKLKQMKRLKKSELIRNVCTVQR